MKKEKQKKNQKKTYQFLSFSNKKDSSNMLDWNKFEVGNDCNKLDTNFSIRFLKKHKDASLNILAMNHRRHNILTFKKANWILNTL